MQIAGLDFTPPMIREELTFRDCGANAKYAQSFHAYSKYHDVLILKLQPRKVWDRQGLGLREAFDKMRGIPRDQWPTKEVYDYELYVDNKYCGEYRSFDGCIKALHNGKLPSLITQYFRAQNERI